MSGSKEIYITSTLSFCVHCQDTESARIVARENGVFLERLCPKMGAQSTKIASDYRWYMDRAMEGQEVTKPKKVFPSSKGCPHDCGLCEWHSSSIHLPVFSITNDCNLDCPICFTYNRKDMKYYKSVEEAGKIFDAIFESAGDVELINMTGGEPTLHPDLFKLIDLAKKRGIKRVTMNTNGIRLAQENDLAVKLKEAGVHLVLSLDTLDPGKSKVIHGVDISAYKQKTLELLESLEIPTTILPVCIKGVNEDDVAHIVSTYLRKDFVRSITIQNMTFTGKNGSHFAPRDHIAIDEVESLLAETDCISKEDFFTPGSYHPLCYSVAYYIKEGDALYSLAKVLGRNKLSEYTKDSYFLNPDNDFSFELREGINRLWAEGQDEEYIKSLRKILIKFYPHNKNLSKEERNALAEASVKLLYIHPHMDEDNFDIDRVSRCGDVVPDESGRMVPACAYNLLYRQKDARFWKE